MVDLAAQTILIVDDQEFVRTIVRSMLTQMGVTSILEASDGTQAFAVVNTQMPDIIICDMHMDGMDGMEFVSHVRRGKTTLDRDHPVIILTGDKDRLLTEVTEQAGATMVLHKPVAIAALKQAIVNAVGYDFSR